LASVQKFGVMEGDWQGARMGVRERRRGKRLVKMTILRDERSDFDLG
jgi:hypothetical protein